VARCGPLSPSMVATSALHRPVSCPQELRLTELVGVLADYWNWSDHLEGLLRQSCKQAGVSLDPAVRCVAAVN
jgi:hypothetical protein